MNMRLRIVLLSLSFFLFGFLTIFIAYSQANAVNFKTVHMKPLVHLVATKTKKALLHSSVPITSLRFHKHQEFTRLVFDLPSPIKFIERHHKKAKLATIQLKNSTLSKKAKAILKNKKFPHGIRFTKKRTGPLTVTINLRSWASYKFKTLRDPYRLVLDLYFSPNSKDTLSKKRKSPSGQALLSPVEAQPMVKAIQDMIIVIDPGHGGKDPGAIGQKGTKEKDLTLKISKSLKNPQKA